MHDTLTFDWRVTSEGSRKAIHTAGLSDDKMEDELASWDVDLDTKTPQQTTTAVTEKRKRVRRCPKKLHTSTSRQLPRCSRNRDLHSGWLTAGDHQRGTAGQNDEKLLFVRKPPAATAKSTELSDVMSATVRPANTAAKVAPRSVFIGSRRLPEVAVAPLLAANLPLFGERFERLVSLLVAESIHFRDFLCRNGAVRLDEL